MLQAGTLLAILKGKALPFRNQYYGNGLQILCLIVIIYVRSHTFTVQ